MEQQRISAVILAAGPSSRIGEVTQLMPFGNSTLLETVLDTVRHSQVTEVVVVLDASAAELRDRVSFENARVIVNQQFHEGIGASLRTGIAHVTGDAALVVFANQPFVKSETIDCIISEYRQRKPQIAIPVYRGFPGNPVLLDRSVFGEIIRLTGDIGCRAIFGGHRENILKIPVDDVGVLLDIDTRQDFEKLKRAAVPPIEAPDSPTLTAGSAGQLVIVGSEKTGRVLASLAHLMKFQVVIIDPFLPLEEAPGADLVVHELDFSKLPPGDERFVVIASGGRFDEEAVEQALSQDTHYVALVANRKRAQEVLSRVVGKNIDAAALARVRTKAGIDIHAEGPEEIALSIMAEIIAERYRTSE